MKHFNTESHKKFFKPFVVIFGTALGIFIYSFNLGLNQGVFTAETKGELKTLAISATDLPGDLSKSLAQSTNKSKGRIHHNFLVTWLDRESSHERKNIHSEAQAEFFSGIKQIHQLVTRQISVVL
jgi:hypothetical protein